MCLTFFSARSLIMDDANTSQHLDGANLVDRAANSADRALDAARQAAGSAIDSVADKVHAVRDRASPALDRLTSPVDRLVSHTHAAPLQSLLVAAATGAALMALLGMLRGSRN
jgi:ElaB/YqjD/DUF883 family membrane-anchored ribosome-binding protein